MRISTNMIHDLPIRSIQGRQEDIYRTQAQLSSGRKILAPSDAPVDAVRVMERTDTLNRIKQFDRNIGFADDWLKQQDSLFGQVGDLLQGVRDIAIQMNNKMMTRENRANAAQVIRGQIEQLLGMSNTRDVTGNYLFSGYMSQVKPFTVDVNGNVLYNGDQGQRKVQVEASQQVTVAEDGSSLFMLIPNGNGTFLTAPGAGNLGNATMDGGSLLDPAAWNAAGLPNAPFTVTFTKTVDPINPNFYKTTYLITDGGGAEVALGGTPVDVNGQPSAAPADANRRLYTAGQGIRFNGIEFTVQGEPETGDTFTVSTSTDQSVFATLKALADALDKPTATDIQSTVLANAISTSLTHIDQALNHFQQARSRVGDRLNQLDALREAFSTESILHQGTISKLQDTDYAEAISNLSRQTQALEAAQKTFSATKDLTLFRYL